MMPFFRDQAWLTQWIVRVIGRQQMEIASFTRAPQYGLHRDCAAAARFGLHIAALRSFSSPISVLPARRCTNRHRRRSGSSSPASRAAQAVRSSRSFPIQPTGGRASCGAQ
jgi:hypothetical protein